MANTFVKIASVTVGSGGAASMTFSSIPATFTDLVVKMSARGNNSAVFSSIKVTLNGNTSSYSNRYIEGSGAAASSGTLLTDSYFAGEAVGDTATASTFGNAEIYIPNYTSANYKSASTDAVSENNAATAYTALVANLWSNTAAVTIIELSAAGASFVQYSTATLYGIKSS